MQCITCVCVCLCMSAVCISVGQYPKIHHQPLPVVNIGIFIKWQPTGNTLLLEIGKITMNDNLHQFHHDSRRNM